MSADMTTSRFAGPFSIVAFSLAGRDSEGVGEVPVENLPDVSIDDQRERGVLTSDFTAFWPGPR